MQDWLVRGPGWERGGGSAELGVTGLVVTGAKGGDERVRKENRKEGGGSRTGYRGRPAFNVQAVEEKLAQQWEEE